MVKLMFALLAGKTLGSIVEIDYIFKLIWNIVIVSKPCVSIGIVQFILTTVVSLGHI